VIETNFTDKATWKRSSGNGPSGKPIYAEPVEIICRKQQRIRIVRNREGQEVVSTTEVWVRTIVGYDDLIDDRPILAIAEGKALTGETDFWKLCLG